MPNRISYQLQAKTPFRTRISQHSGRFLRHQQGNARGIDIDGKGGDWRRSRFKGKVPRLREESTMAAFTVEQKGLLQS